MAVRSEQKRTGITADLAESILVPPVIFSFAITARIFLASSANFRWLQSKKSLIFSSRDWVNAERCRARAIR